MDAVALSRGATIRTARCCERRLWVEAAGPHLQRCSSGSDV